MALYLDPVPSGAFVDGEGRGLPPLVRWMNAVKTLFLSAASSGGVAGDIWRGHGIAYCLPNQVTPTVIGDTFTTTVGTTSFPALTNTNLLTSKQRNVCTTAAGANSQARMSGTALWWIGNSAGLGGFRVEFDIGVVTTQTTMRIAAGVASFAIALTADVSATTDCVFLGCDAGDTNMQIMHNDGAGTCTKIDLGASFPKTNNVVYRVVFTCAANGSTIDYAVTRFDSAASASGTISTNLPTNSVFMLAQVGFGNGGTAAAAAGAFFRYLGEQVTM